MSVEQRWTFALYRGNDLHFERDLEDFDDERVRSFLERPVDEEIYGNYQLSVAQAERLAEMLGVSLTEMKLGDGDSAYLEGYVRS